MQQNISTTDKMIRYIIAIVFVIIGITVSPWWLIVSAIMLITALTQKCPTYTLAGINTKPAHEHRSTTPSLAKRSRTTKKKL